MSAASAKDYTRSVDGGRQLRAIRLSMKYGQADFARLMETPLRTVQDWEAGRRPVPGVALKCAQLLAERDRWVMQGVVEKVALDIARDHPYGIRGEAYCDD